MFEAHFPARIVYGEDSIRFLGSIDAKRVFILADEIFHKYNTKLFDNLDEMFKEKGTVSQLHFGEGGEPSLDFVKRASAAMTSFQPDLVVAIGGGSTLDSAKVMEVYYEHPGITDAEISNRFHLPPIRRKAKLAAVPTTSGSGSEATPIAVMYVQSDNPDIPHVKRGIADYQLIPDWVILDPAFSLTMPKSVTASTGLDAFVHAMEAYVSNKPKSTFGDDFAIKAMQKVMTNLPLVLAEPKNMAYRSEMQLAATMGGLALANRASGCSHAVGKQLATLCPISHGISVAMMLPQVIQANASVRLAEYVEIAHALGSRARSEQNALKDLISMVKNLLRAAGCPRTLADIRLDKDKFFDNLDLLVRNSQADAAMKGNPRPLTNDEVRAIFLSLTPPDQAD